jgi:uncharacterized membrane protein YfcA
LIKFASQRMRSSSSHGLTVPLIPLGSLLFLIIAAYFSRSSPSSELALGIVLLSATVSSIVGFAFSPIAGAILFYVNTDVVEIVQILLVASIAQQLYCVWRLQSRIASLEFLPYVIGSLATLPVGIFLLLKSPASILLPCLGVFLLAYGVFTTVKPTIISRKSNPLTGRILAGAFGGITGGVAAFPGAFVAIWCQIQGFEKDRQRSIVQPFILINQIAALSILAVAKPLETVGIVAAQYAAPATFEKPPVAITAPT